MIVADTSAIVALVFDEPERDAIALAIQQADRVLLSTVSDLKREWSCMAGAGSERWCSSMTCCGCRCSKW